MMQFATYLGLFAIVFLAVALAFLAFSGRFYAMAGAANAQAQACGLSLQVGPWIVGWAPHRWFNGSRRGCRPTRLIIFAPLNSGCRVVFQFLVFGRGLSFATVPARGVSTWAWPGPGVRLVYRA